LKKVVPIADNARNRNATIEKIKVKKPSRVGEKGNQQSSLDYRPYTAGSSISLKKKLYSKARKGASIHVQHTDSSSTLHLSKGSSSAQMHQHLSLKSGSHFKNSQSSHLMINVSEGLPHP
jgi:hypothetical protein